MKENNSKYETIYCICNPCPGCGKKKRGLDIIINPDHFLDCESEDEE